MHYSAARFKPNADTCNNCTVRAAKYNIPLAASAIRDHVRNDTQINDAIYAFQQLTHEHAAFSKQDILPMYCVPVSFNFCFC